MIFPLREDWEEGFGVTACEKREATFWFGESVEIFCARGLSEAEITFAVFRWRYDLFAQHFLNFLPEPQGHGSFLPGLSIIPRFLSVNYRGNVVYFHEKMSSTISAPIVRPPWTGSGKKIESMVRKALFDFSLLDGSPIAIALSGGKDSLTLLFMLRAILGRGFPDARIEAIHVTGAFSCGAGLHLEFIQSICEELEVPLHVIEVEQRRETLECYSCSRARRSAIFRKALELGCSTVAFGHHKDDMVQTLLMNVLHKGEFAGMLPKLFMKDYGVTIIRPMVYLSEKEIFSFASRCHYARITCQCPVGQDSKRKQTKELIEHMTDIFPHSLDNLASVARKHALPKAMRGSNAS